MSTGFSDPDRAHETPAGDRAAAPVQGQTGVPLTVSRPELLADGGDHLFRKLVHDFFAFTARHAAIRDGHARRIGLAGVEYTILISIAHLSRDSVLNVKTLADHLHMSTGFVTNATNRLEGMGLIDKTRDTGDRRRIILTVTPAGIARLEALAPYQRRVNDVEFGDLSAEDFVRLCAAIESLVASSERAVRLQEWLESAEEPAGEAAE